MSAAEDLTAKIVAKGQEIAALKAAKPPTLKDDLAPLVAELLALKLSFKETTGQEYGPPPAADKPKVEKPKGPADEPPAREGPSKKELNKLAKKEKKEEHKSSTPSGAADAAPAAKTDALAPAPASANGDLTVTLSMQQPADLSRHVLALAAASGATLPKVTFVASTLPAHQPYLTGRGGSISGDVTIARYLAKVAGSALYPTDPWEAAKVDTWLDAYTAGIEGGSSGAVEVLALADKSLGAERSLLVGQALTMADVAIFCLSKKAPAGSSGPNVSRLLKSVAPAIKPAASIVKTGGGGGGGGGGGAKEAKGPKEEGAEDDEEGGAFLDLPGAEEGKVVTRFPPEPSGYLHIGHAKAVLLNQYYAQRYKGRLLVRFDDTNPSKEKEEFEDNIIQDLATLNVVADKVSHTSDHFAKCEELARKMLREGKGYMDNTDQETMQAERMTRTESRLRNTTPEENLAIFESLLKGEESAKKYCLRAKIDMSSVNGTMRDPVMYRGNDTPHHRTGTKHKAYPTYDFACPIVDSLEGVTHALRTTEYNDRDEQYHWIQAALGLAHRTQIRAFGKMNFVHTCLSKRKLAWFVENKLVEGWFDPRFPTIQGIMRRGVTIEGLKSFILSQGASRRIITMEWDKFWAENKQVLETTAARYMGVMTPGEVTLTLTNVAAEITAHSTPIMPQFPDKGSRIIRRFNKVFIDHADALVMSVGEQVTLLRWGNVTIKSIEKSADGTRVVSMTADNNPESTDFKKTKKYTWLAATPDVVPATVVEFDYLISKHKLEDGDKFEDHLTKVTRTDSAAIVDPCLRVVPKGSIIQLERIGFFRVDEAYSAANNKPVVLFRIPDGREKCCKSQGAGGKK